MKKISITFVLVLTAILVLACSVSQGIEGTVYDSIYGDRITEISITLKNIDNMRLPDIEATPDKNGNFEIEAEPGRYRIETKDDELFYKRYIKSLVIEEGIQKYDIAIEPIVKTWIHGLVAQKQEDKKPEDDYKTLIPNAIIEIDGVKATTDAEGNFEIKYIRPGLKKVSITAEGYKPYNKAYNLSRGETIEYFEIEPLVDKGRSLVSSISNLISFKMEILKGSSSQNISDSYSVTLLNLPFTYEIESSAGKYKYTGLAYSKFNKKNSEYARVDKDEMADVDELLKHSIKLFDDIGYFVSNTEGMKMGETIGNIAGYSCSPYTFKYTDENDITYDANLWIILDGSLETYPAKLSMETDNSYFEVNLFAFNSFENNVILND